MGEIVWFETVDRGAWSAHVERVAGHEREGILVITDNSNEQIVHSEIVSLSYGAVFGPDVEDVMFWQERAIEVIDDPTLNSIHD